MYCSRLLVLQEWLNESQIERLDKYFAELIGSACDNITVSKVAKALGVSPDIASKILTICLKEGLLTVSYGIRCPECNMLIKRVISPLEIPEGIFECYGCNKEIEVTPKDIELLYSLEDNRIFMMDSRLKLVHQPGLLSMMTLWRVFSWQVVLMNTYFNYQMSNISIWRICT